MSRLTLLSIPLLLLSVSAFGQVIDPNIGFCNVPASSSCGNDPNIVTSATSFGMWTFGSNDSNMPWYLLLAIPETSAGSVTSGPTLTSPSFTLSSGTRVLGDFGPSTSGDIYSFASADTGGLAGNSSMNATNLFGSAEQAAFGGTPADFAIFVYTVNPGITGATAYTFNSSPGLSAGTFIAAVAVGGSSGNIQFSTPFTTAGLDGPPTSVPEPTSVLLLATMGLILGTAYRRRTRSS